MTTFPERCEQAKHDALRAPVLTDEEKAAHLSAAHLSAAHLSAAHLSAAHLSAVAAVAARDAAQRAPQGDLLEGEQG